MRARIRTLAVAAALALVPAGQAQAAADGEVARRCANVAEELMNACYGGDVLLRDAAALCRFSRTVPDHFCAAPLARFASEADIAAYEQSWVHRALGLQYELAGDVGLVNAPWVGTHNSYNSIVEMGPALSVLDSNQQLSIVEQLRLDVRSLELDLHWFPNLSAGGARVPVVCHARAQHEGCTIEHTLEQVLTGIVGWLNANPGQVLLLYLEDHLDNATGYDTAAAQLREKLGKRIYAPAGGACRKLPLDLTREAVRAAGAQVVLVSDCGSGDAWPGVVFDWSDQVDSPGHVESRPRGFRDFSDCGPDYERPEYDGKLVRYYEDSTWLTNGASEFGLTQQDEGITPATAAAMTRCGVDLTGMDQLLPADGRLEAHVWSWAPNEPGASGDCAVRRGDGRWAAVSCDGLRRAGCRMPDGSWAVSAAAVPVSAATGACRDAGGIFAVPRTGYEGALLNHAAGGNETWLAYMRVGGTWTRTTEPPGGGTGSTLGGDGTGADGATGETGGAGDQGARGVAGSAPAPPRSSKRKRKAARRPRRCARKPAKTRSKAEAGARKPAKRCRSRRKRAR